MSPAEVAAILFGTFGALIVLRIPVSFALGLACIPVFFVDDRLTPLDDPEDEVREPLDRVGLGRETLGRRDTLLERDELEREPLGRGGLDRALLEREGRFPANNCDAI